MKKQFILIILALICILGVLNAVSAETTERVSLVNSEPNGDSSEPSITPDGRYIAFD